MLYTQDQISKSIAAMSGWSAAEEEIIKNFTLKNFSDALAFVVKTGVEAEKADHHPEIRLHSWNQVEIKLSTHSAGGITEKDIELASKIDEL